MLTPAGMPEVVYALQVGHGRLVVADHRLRQACKLWSGLGVRIEEVGTHQFHETEEGSILAAVGCPREQKKRPNQAAILHALQKAVGKGLGASVVYAQMMGFVEHCIRSLRPGGRAAIVVPDNVLFEDGRGKALRRMIMDWCDLHTILRLPTGIFYAQGVKTNVLFLTRGKTETGNTKATWIYHLPAQMPKFGKTMPLTEAHFEGFVKAYGADPNGAERGPDEGEEGRWRQFSRADVAARGDNLDLSWLCEAEEEAEEGLIEPEDIAAAILGHLQVAMLEIEALGEELGSDLLEAAQ